MEGNLQCLTQVIGEPCENYYELVCSGVCHIVPPGLCFKEVAQRFMSNCYEDQLDSDTLELWADLDVFYRQANIPVRFARFFNS